MKTIEELKKVLERLKVSKEMLECKINSLTETLGSCQDKKLSLCNDIKRTEKNINKYKNYKEKQTWNDCYEEIVDWLCGQNINDKFYSGAVCPLMGLYHNEGSAPDGTESEIKAILKKYNYDYIIYNTIIRTFGVDEVSYLIIQRGTISTFTDKLKENDERI